MTAWGLETRLDSCMIGLKDGNFKWLEFSLFLEFVVGIDEELKCGWVVNGGDRITLCLGKKGRL